MAKSLSKKPTPSKPIMKSVKAKAPPPPPPSPVKKSAAKARVEPPKSAAKARTALKPPAASPKRAAPIPAPAPPAAPLRSVKVRSEPVPEARPIQPPVPTNDKPRKNQAGMNSRDLEYFRDLLLAKRRELVGDVSAMEREALRTSGGTNLSTLPIHMADMGTDNYEQEFTLGLVEKDRNLLREINSALAKIQNGAYGICEATGKPIGRPRLEAQPWARFSIEHARQLEKRGGR